MTKLYFRVGEMEGFNSSKLAYKQLGFSLPLRELVQNSLDASTQVGNEKCEINIYLDTIRGKDIPHIKDYRKVLKLAITKQDKLGSYNENAKNVVRLIKLALEDDPLDILMFADNGGGMSEGILQSLLEERSNKASESSGGSFGIGHLTSYSLSSLRYILYATKYKDDRGRINSLWTGSPILAGYEDKVAERCGRGRILQHEPENEKKPIFQFPQGFPSFMREGMDQIESTGSLVTILGLNKDWGDEAEYTIVSNFFPALVRDELVVTIHQNQEIRKINKAKIEELIDERKHEGQTKHRKGHILSGQSVYQCYQAVQETPKFIELGNGDRVRVYIKNNTEINNTIVLARNGMVITDHKGMLSPPIRSLGQTSDYQSFAIVMDIGMSSSRQLFELVKGAEGPYHNELQRNRFEKRREKELKTLFHELSDKLKKYLVKAKSSSTPLQLFTISKAGIKESSGRYNRSSGQMDEAQIKERTLRIPNPPEPHPIPPGPRPKPNIRLNDLRCKRAIRYVDKKDLMEVILRVTVEQEVTERERVYFSVGLGQDDDNNQASQAVNFINLSINGKDIPISKETNQEIELGRLNKEEYNIQAKVRKPKEFNKAKIALIPILKLKQVRQSKAKQDS